MNDCEGTIGTTLDQNPQIVSNLIVYIICLGKKIICIEAILTIGNESQNNRTMNVQKNAMNNL